MSAEVETAVYYREPAWHGLGIVCEEAMDSKKALELSGLDWTVDSVDFDVQGIKAEGWKANVRSSDKKLLGIVSDKYKIVQNADAFAFTDALIGNGVTYESAGSLFEGKKVWMLAKLPEVKIVDDKVVPYICFVNNHDGKGAVRVLMTPVRVVCNNTLNLALETTPRSWSARHMGSIESRLEEAKDTLFQANKYMTDLAVKADELANSKVTDDDVAKILNKVFPIEVDDSDRVKENIKKMKDSFLSCYFAPDIMRFMNTKWGLINAAADFADHSVPQRKTQTYAERNMDKVINGHPVLDQVVELVSAVA